MARLFFWILLCVFGVSNASKNHGVNNRKSLKNELSVLRATLDRIETKVDKKSGGASVKTADPVQQFQSLVALRFQRIFLGFDALPSAIKMPMIDSVLWRYDIIVALCMGLFFFVGIRFFVRRFVVRQQSNRVTDPVKHVSLLTAAIFVPLLVYVLYGVVVSVFFFPGQGFLGSKKDIAAIMAFPIHLYLCWAILFWTRMVFLSRKTSNIMATPRSLDAQRVAFWLRLFSVCYCVVALTVATFQLIGVGGTKQELAIAFVVDAGLFVCAMVLLRAFFLWGERIPELGRSFNLQRLVGGAKILIAVSTVVWFVDKKSFFNALPLALMTVVALWSMRSVARYVRRVRLAFLWPRRHKPLFFKPLFRSKTWLYQAVQAFIWLVLFKMWMTFFERPSFFAFPLSIKMVSVFVTNVFSIGVIVLIAHILVKGVDRVLLYYISENSKAYEGKNQYFSKRLETLMSMVKTLTRLLIWVPATSLILGKVLSLDVRAWVTGISLGSFGLAFGMQQLVRDFTTGFFVILENNLMVGDEVDIDKHRGHVESISMRTLKIRTDYGMLLTIPFGSMHIVGNKNRAFSAFLVNISVAYEENPDRIKVLVEEAFKQVKAVVGRKVYGGIEIRGIHEVTSFSIVFQAKIKTAPNAQDVVRYAFNRALKEVFDREGVFVPKSPHAVDRNLPSLTNTMCRERGAVGEALS